MLLQNQIWLLHEFHFGQKKKVSVIITYLQTDGEFWVPTSSKFQNRFWETSFVWAYYNLDNNIIPTVFKWFFYQTNPWSFGQIIFCVFCVLCFVTVFIVRLLDTGIQNSNSPLSASFCNAYNVFNSIKLSLRSEMSEIYSLLHQCSLWDALNLTMERANVTASATDLQTDCSYLSQIRRRVSTTTFSLHATTWVFWLTRY